MSEIKLKKLNEFNEIQKEKILFELFSSYKHLFKKDVISQREYFETYSFFKFDILKKNNIVVLEHSGKILGAVNFTIDKNKLKIESIFAKPSRTFFNENKITVGTYLVKHLQKIAKNKKLTLKFTSLSPSAKKTANKIKRNPKRKINLMKRK